LIVCVGTDRLLPKVRVHRQRQMESRPEGCRIRGDVMAS